ncbi:hypothetical protein IV102_07745 [bacterium]|nr:hypothetical protein [bacterium]
MNSQDRRKTRKPVNWANEDSIELPDSLVLQITIDLAFQQYSNLDLILLQTGS